MLNNFGAHIKAVHAWHDGKHEPPETDLLQEVFPLFYRKTANCAEYAEVGLLAGVKEH
jgi:hypothetical protein